MVIWLSPSTSNVHVVYGCPQRTICLVKITTDDGLTGWGEGYGPAGVIKSAIEFLTPSVIGKNPLENETLWSEMYQRSLDFGRRGIFLAGLSAIDIALWDIKGKYFGSVIFFNNFILDPVQKL